MAKRAWQASSERNIRFDTASHARRLGFFNCVSHLCSSHSACRVNRGKKESFSVILRTKTKKNRQAVISKQKGKLPIAFDICLPDSSRCSALLRCRVQYFVQTYDAARLFAVLCRVQLIYCKQLFIFSDGRVIWQNALESQPLLFHP
jgi:hypothetical protein